MRIRSIEGLTGRNDAVLHAVHQLAAHELQGLYKMLPRGYVGLAKPDLDEQFRNSEWGKDAELLVKTAAPMTGITSGRTLKGHQFVRAIQLLSGNLPTRMALHRGHTRGTNRANVLCRRCGVCAETTAHCLSACSSVKDAIS